MRTKPSLKMAALIAVGLIIVIAAGCKKSSVSGNKQQIVSLPNSVMFVGTQVNDSTVIYLLNAATGSLVTKYSYHRNSFENWCVPLAGNGLLYYAENNKISAIDRNTGTMIWKDTIKSYSSSVPILHNDIFYGIYCIRPGSEYVVYALDATRQSDSFLWQYKLNNYTSINYYNGLIYLSGSNLIALDAITGTLKWTLSSPYSLSSLNNGLIISGNSFVDATTGTQIATVPQSVIVSNATQSTSIIYATKELFFTRTVKSITPPLTTSQFSAYDAVTGALKWSVNGGSGYLHNDTVKTVDQIWNSKPIIKTTVTTGTGVYGSVNSIYFSEADINTGNLKWSYNAGYEGQAFTVNNTQYSCGSFTLNLGAGFPANSTIVAADLYTGKVKWTNNNLRLQVGGTIAACLFTSGKGFSNYIQ